MTARKMDIEDCDGDLAEIEQIAESRARIAALEARDAEMNSMAWERGYAAAIERCAQAAENVPIGLWNDESALVAQGLIIAAIRALKDRP